MPVNRWVEAIDIRQFMNGPIHDSTEEGRARFLETQRNVVRELKTLRLYRTLDEVREMPRDNPHRGEALVLTYPVKDVEEAESVDGFTRHMRDIYAWADENRVWLGD